MKFSVCYSDNPWKFNSRTNSDTKFGSGMNKYQGMSESELIELYVNSVEPIMERNCAILSWCVSPKLDQFFHIADALKPLGFRYCTTLFTWTKLSKAGVERKLPGFYSLSNTETVQLLVRGSMEVVKKGIPQIVTEDFVNEEEIFYSEILKPHSTKPLAVRQKITEMFGEVPSIELFARTEKKQENNWIFAGNDVEETKGMYIKEALSLIRLGMY